ncbi:IS3 family transposase [Streptomyces achromogenes]|uniref:IS3 family transposase n=1 Tax=Streptomyces achromogenes TaxID=67255 RepID=UPI0036F5491C
MPLIEAIPEQSGGTYEARRITRALGRRGREVARRTVERLTAELGLEGVIRGRRRRTTVPEPMARDYRTWSTATSRFPADQLWVAGMTHVRTWAGWAYAASVMDVYSW